MRQRISWPYVGANFHNHFVMKNLSVFAFTVLMLISQTMSARLSPQSHLRPNADLSGRKLTPELLWSMGRIGSVSLSPDGEMMVYTVTYYNIDENKGHTAIYVKNFETDNTVCLDAIEGNSPAFIDGGKRIAYLSTASGSSQLWTANIDGTDAKQASTGDSDVEGFLFSPNEKRAVLIRSVAMNDIIAAHEPDLPKASGMVINDLMYKHWDSYVTSVPHPFVADFNGQQISNEKDILEGEPYECPMLPFGGTEQLAWAPSSDQLLYTCRKKLGKAYALSTDSDIFLYDIASGATRNLCKPADYKDQEIDATRSLQDQGVNAQREDMNVGYDQNPQFSPNGRYVAWLSMERDGYESDRSRLCVLNLQTGEKTYVTEAFQSGVDAFAWAPNSKTIYFSGVWHGKTQLYSTNLKGEVSQLTDEQADFALIAASADGNFLIASKQSMAQATEIYKLSLKSRHAKPEQITDENGTFYASLDWGKVSERWVKTVDGKDMLCWVVYPPHFDPTKKYPTLLFCEGGPQSPVSQFWSYRWNFQIMAANGYIVIAPNRRGLPGFGMEWLEEISGDYTGLCMQDYLSAIDDISKENYVDTERLGAVGASFGGFSVYWLAGNHDKRFKAFIAHDGIYNTQQQYVETEEMWFPNWDLKAAPWLRTESGELQKAYATSPHLYVDRWDTPILCIHGQRDFRIEYTQAESAFAAARLRGIDAQLLLFPDENHWVLKPQNGILWQRTFFRWLDKWLKY